MPEHPNSLNLMLAAWNESEREKIRDLLEQALSPQVRFVDPSIDLTGIDAFEKNVRDVQKQIPGAIYSRTSGVDSQHNFHRYHWAIHQQDKLVVRGFDVAETDREGKVVSVIGFFGPIPKLEP